MISVWSRDIDALTAIQEAAVRAGVLSDGGNLLVVAPTSSGKTFVGEMAAARMAMKGQRYVFLAVPTKSLAEEHYLRLQERYRDLMSVVISTGDRLEHDDDIRHGDFDLAVLTYEKLAALVIQVPSLIMRCGSVVVDEGQMLGDKERGQDLEVLITQILIQPAPPQLVVLSASLDELNQLHRWLRAKPIINAERPVPLVQAVCSAGSGRALVRLANGNTEERQVCDAVNDVDELASRLAIQHAEAGEQVIIFRSTVPATVQLATKLEGRMPAKGLPEDLHTQLLRLEDPEIVARFRKLLASGVAYHNADLAPEERHLVEGAFRAGHVRILVSTTTLAMGVNMPADVVILVDSNRPHTEPGGRWSTEPISVAEYRNASGRAGRLGLRTEGTAILLAENDVRRRQLFDFYVLGEVEPVESQIPKQRLEDVIFRLVAGRVVRNQEALLEFLTATFAYLTFYARHGGPNEVQAAVRGVIQEIVDAGLVIVRDGQLLSTPVARSLAASGLSLATAMQLKSIVDRLVRRELPPVDIIFEIARCRESGNRPFLPRRGSGFVDPRPNWNFRSVSHDPTGLFKSALDAVAVSDEEMQALQQTACLMNWMGGEDAGKLQRQFGMSRERLKTMGGYVAWLLEALSSAAIAGAVDVGRVKFVRKLAVETRYGVPAELAPLARLRPAGVPREALMQLRALGVVEPDDLLEADPTALQPALSPLQVTNFKRAILEETELSLRRKRKGHLRAAAEIGIPPTLIETLYSATSTALEDAVCDALKTAGLAASRIKKQPHGQEDIQIAVAAGTVVASVTGSQDDQKAIKWTKAQEVMGQGAGLNPVNCVCFGRPRFEGLAERNARDIAREGGDRKLLLVPVDVLVETMIRCTIGEMTAGELGDLLASRRGVLGRDDLPAKPQDGESIQVGEATPV